MISPSARQARTIWLAATGLAIAVLIFLLAALIWGLSRALDILSPVLWPLAIAGVIAYLLDPVVDFLEQKRQFSRPRAILLVFCAGLLLMGGVLASVVPRLVRETSDLVAAVPGYTRQIQIKVMEWTAKSPWWAKMFTSHAPTTMEPVTNSSSAAIGPPVVTSNAPPVVPSEKPKEPAWVKKLTESVVPWLTA